jgi:ATP-dependent DNA helicase RecG
MGTGTADMIRIAQEILHALALKHTGNFRENYLEPTLKVELIERIYPNHPQQKYRLT